MTTGLMMGCCSAQFVVDTERIAELPRLMGVAKRRMNYHRVRRVRAYRPGNTVQGNTPDLRAVACANLYERMKK